MRWTGWALLLLMVAPDGAPHGVLDGDTIVRRSIAANRADWFAAPDYAYMERTRDDNGTKTYDVTMILGSSYKRLVKDGDALLSPAEQVREEGKLRAEVAKREAESPDERARGSPTIRTSASARTASSKRCREPSITRSPRHVEWVHASSTSFRPLPRKGYDPPNVESRVFTAMRGEFWVDTITFQWVRASARVLRPVSIEGFSPQFSRGLHSSSNKCRCPATSGSRSTFRSDRGVRSCSSSTITSTRTTPISTTDRSRTRHRRAGFHGPWLGHPAAINVRLLSIVFRFGVEEHRVDAQPSRTEH